jgi:hypothetical protein
MGVVGRLYICEFSFVHECRVVARELPLDDFVEESGNLDRIAGAGVEASRVAAIDGDFLGTDVGGELLVSIFLLLFVEQVFLGSNYQDWNLQRKLKVRSLKDSSWG